MIHIFCDFSETIWFVLPFHVSVGLIDEQQFSLFSSTVTCGFMLCCRLERSSSHMRRDWVGMCAGLSGSCSLWADLVFIFTVRLHVMQRTVLLSQFCPSVRCVYCDKIKWCTADILIPHARAITLVLWNQYWLVGDAPSLSNVRQKWPTPSAKLIVPCNKYFISQIYIFYSSMCLWSIP